MYNGHDCTFQQKLNRENGKIAYPRKYYLYRTYGMCESAVNVCGEHVGDGLDGVLPQGRDVSHQWLLVDLTNLRPVNLVQRVYQVHE